MVLSRTFQLMCLVTVVFSVQETRSSICVDKKTAYHANPWDCNKFYVCFLGRALPFSCGLFHVFNPVTYICDRSFNGGCRTPQSPAVTERPTEAPTSRLPLTTNAPPAQTPAVTKLPTEAPTSLLPLTTLAPPLQTSVVTELPTEAPTSPYPLTTLAPPVQTPEVTELPTETPTSPSPFTTLAPPMESTTSPTPVPSHVCPFIIMCYYLNRVFNDSIVGGEFQPNDIDPNLCTHIVVSSNSEANFEIRAIQRENLLKVVSLKEINPSLKVLVAHYLTAGNLEDVSASPLRAAGVDGIYVNWDIPASQVLTPEEEETIYQKNFKDVRKVFDDEETDEDRLLLVAGLPADHMAYYDIPVLKETLDFFDIKVYDLLDTYERETTRHHSPLYPGPWEVGPDRDLNIESAVDKWVSQDISKEKILVGIPFYGRSFTLTNETENNAVGAPVAGPGKPGPYTQEEGRLSFYEVCQLLNTGGAKMITITEQAVPYIVANEAQWVAYDHCLSVRTKMQFVKENGFGGVVPYGISYDDFEGVFCRIGKYPLLKTINDELCT